MNIEIQTTNLPDRQMISISRRVTVDQLGDHLGQAYETLAQIIDQLDLERDGPVLAIYHGPVNETQDGPVEVGIPVKSLPAAGSPVQSRTLPGGPIAYTVLTMRQAHFPEILDFYHGLHQWIQDNGHDIAGSPREVYFTKPMDADAPLDEPFMEIAWPYR